MPALSRAPAVAPAVASPETQRAPGASQANAAQDALGNAAVQERNLASVQPEAGSDLLAEDAGHDAAVTGDPLLRHGSVGATVLALQDLLNQSGAHLHADGMFGSLTDAAVRAFQHAHGLPVDGAVGPKTAAALNGSSSPVAAPNTPKPSAAPKEAGDTAAYRVTGKPFLRVGMRGPVVEELQRRLIAHGAKIQADGDFGAGTDAAVRGFQQANGLEADGTVGADTANRLYDDKAAKIGKVAGGDAKFGGLDGYADIRQGVLAAARGHRGAPYYWGADGPQMFDCSGFVLYVLRQDTHLINWGDMAAGDIKRSLPGTSNPKAGDLVFFSNGGSTEHVMMATGSGSNEIGASGGGSHTFGNDANACVKENSWTADSRGKSFGSIDGLIAKYVKAHAGSNK